jgi:outer membrane lipoprotein-sorting protein
MRSVDRLVCAAALALPLLLSGCNILPTTRHLPVPKAPSLVQSATPEQLVAQINQRWNALNSLTATVEIKATALNPSEGLEKDYPSCRGFILMRKPKMLRVAGTYFGVKIFDMASDGTRFTLVIPSKNLAIEGSNTVKEKSTNQWENLRPDFFLNSLVVRGLDPDNEYMMTNDTETVEDVAKKHLYTMPEYILNIMRPKAGNEIQAVRVITLHRDDMLPYDQDIYDGSGNLETQVTYGHYADFDAGKFPSTVTIKRPQEGLQLVLTVEKVEENVDLPDTQFKVDIPSGAKVEQK